MVPPGCVLKLGLGWEGSVWSSSEAVGAARDRTILYSQRLLSRSWVHSVYFGGGLRLLGFMVVQR